MMKALRFARTGSLESLAVETMDRPVPRVGEVLVRIQAAAINPSDVKNVLGKMKLTTVPRTPGRDFAGVVEQGPSEWIGRPVFGTGGDLGFRRDGSHAEYLAAPVEAILARPKSLGPEQAAALGLPYMTAWAGAVDAAGLQAGETILITGVTGAVGSAAARIARWKGARVIGTIRQVGEQNAVPYLPVGQFVNLEDGPLPESVMSATAGQGVHVVFDVVGGPLFEPCVRSLAHRGRYVAIASTGDGRVGINLTDFYHREGRIFGVDTLKLDFAASAAVLQCMMPGVEDGIFKPPDFETVTLDRAVNAYARVNDGTAAENRSSLSHRDDSFCIGGRPSEHSVKNKPRNTRKTRKTRKMQRNVCLSVFAFFSCFSGISWFILRELFGRDTSRLASATSVSMTHSPRTLRQSDGNRRRGTRCLQRAGRQRIVDCGREPDGGGIAVWRRRNRGKNGKGLTYANPVRAVLDALKVDLLILRVFYHVNTRRHNTGSSWIKPEPPRSGPKRCSAPSRPWWGQHAKEWRLRSEDQPRLRPSGPAAGTDLPESVDGVPVVVEVVGRLTKQ